MDATLHNLHLLLPEIFVLTMACVILVTDAYLPERLKGLTYQLTQGTLLAALLLTIGGAPEQAMTAVSGTYVSDPMSTVLKSFIYLVTFFVFLYSRQYLAVRKLLKGEFFVLGLFAVLGMMVMVSANHFLTLYLGLELLSLSLYALVAMHRDSQQASEAAMKYFVLGALASGLLLYGMSMLYGATGTLSLPEVAAVIAQGKVQQQLLVFGLVFIVTGVAFKFGAVPFHMWVPDVYQGAPTPVTLFLGSAPKLAAFAMLMRLLAEGMPGLAGDWQGMLMLLAMLSIAIGNVVAIAQTNIKRMLAYSTIAHVGFIFLGVLTATAGGYAASMFYTIVYALMTLAAFGMILLLSRTGFEAENLDDYKGLNERHPWYALLMTFVMLAMLGLPPLLGFWAKFAVLKEVVAAGFTGPAIAAVVFSVIGAFFYLRVIWLMYFDKPEDTASLEAGTELRLTFSANGLLVLLLGLFPQQLMEICLVALG